VRVTAAQFIGAAATPGAGRRPARPIAIAGRSNVGKSSLINALLGRRGLARTSRTPGRTRQLNFFLVNDAFRIVDLPGYASPSVREGPARLGPLVEGYLAGRRRCAGSSCWSTRGAASRRKSGSCSLSETRALPARRGDQGRQARRQRRADGAAGARRRARSRRAARRLLGPDRRRTRRVWRVLTAWAAAPARAGSS
jgi:hypothetical protein